MPGNAPSNAGKSDRAKVRSAVRALRDVPAVNQNLSIAASDWTEEANVSGELSSIARYQANRPIAIRPGVAADVNIVAYEEFTSGMGNSSQETYTLSHDIVDADSVVDDLVLYQGGSAVTADSIDYANNQFDYTDDGSGDELDAFYVVQDQALVDIRKVAPRNVRDSMKELDAGFANRRDQREDAIEFSFDHPLDGVVPTDWEIEVLINAPYDVRWEGANNAGSYPDNLRLQVPIRRARDEVPELEPAVKAII